MKILRELRSVCISAEIVTMRFDMRGSCADHKLLKGIVETMSLWRSLKKLYVNDTYDGETEFGWAEIHDDIQEACDSRSISSSIQFANLFGKQFLPRNDSA